MLPGLTDSQFDEIAARLEKWRNVRRLTVEQGRDNIVGNLLEELTEFARAESGIERVDAVCDIAVYAINAGAKNSQKYAEKFYRPTFSGIIEKVSDYVAGYCNLDPIIYTAYACCEKSLGFNFYKCLLETCKELETRSGEFDKTLGKFRKYKGAYSLSEVMSMYPQAYIAETESSFVVTDGDIHCDLVKWYKADYESCRI